MDTEATLFGTLMLVLILGILATISRNESARTVYVKRRRKRELPKETRLAPRYKTSLRIKYNTSIEEGISWIRDVSVNGAQLFLNKSLETGTRLNIEINLPHESNPIFVMGDIIWVKENNAGFHFIEKGHGEINRLVEYCKLKEDSYKL